MFSQAIALLLIYAQASEPADRSFAAMPTGTYRYLSDHVSDSGDRASQTFLFRKSGSVVIGAELIGDRARTHAPVLNCFRGQAVGDRIVRITRVSPPYSPLSKLGVGAKYRHNNSGQRGRHSAPRRSCSTYGCRTAISRNLHSTLLALTT